MGHAALLSRMLGGLAGASFPEVMRDRRPAAISGIRNEL